MASRLETVKTYLLSVAERTFGIEAYRKEVAKIERFNAVDSERYTVLNREDVEKSGFHLGIFQILMPAVTEVMLNDKGSKMNSSLFKESLKVVNDTLPAAAVDLWAMAPALLSHNPVEFVILKLAANAVTHVGLDVLGAAAKRFRNFRPSANILAV